MLGLCGTMSSSTSEFNSSISTFAKFTTTAGSSNDEKSGRFLDDLINSPSMFYSKSQLNEMDEERERDWKIEGQQRDRIMGQWCTRAGHLRSNFHEKNPHRNNLYMKSKYQNNYNNHSRAEMAKNVTQEIAVLAKRDGWSLVTKACNVLCVGHHKINLYSFPSSSSNHQHQWTLLCFWQ